MDPRQLQRFHNEARAAAGLHHTNIVPVYAVGVERGVHYYAMQLIDGQTLADFIAQQRGEMLSQVPTMAEAAAASATTAPPAAQATSAAPRDAAYFRRVVEWGIQAAEALDCAHSLGVIHRDVKPANLMVDAAGRLWVTDFGLAQVQSDARLTQTGDLVGTLRYMSPEQALAKRVVVDHRTDVYSLGATLYELLTLEPAFNGADRQELLRQIAFEEPRPQRRINKAIPAELETIVLKALEKNPAERYATAHELADDLRRFLEDKPIRAKRPSLRQRARKWARRHRPLVGAVVAVLVLAAIMLVGSVGWVARDQTTRRQAITAEVRKALTESMDWQQLRRLPEALTAARRATEIMAGAEADAAVRRDAQARLADLELLARLEDVRLELTSGKESRVGTFFGNRRFEEVFREANLNVLALSVAEAADRIRATTVAVELAAVLDAWAIEWRLRGPRGEPGWKHLLQVARAADQDDQRTRVREALEGNDAQALVDLAVPDELARLLPATVEALAPALWYAGAVQQAEGLLREVQRQHPDDFWTNYLLADLLRNSKPPQVEKAIAFMRVAVALRPQSPIVRLQLGQYLHDARDIHGAIAEYREILRRNKDYPKALHNLGHVLSEQGKPAEAAAAFQKAIAIKPDYAWAHNHLGCALREQGKLAEAVAAHQKAIELLPDYAEAHSNLGIALRDQGKLAEAVAAHQKAIELDPNLAGAYSNLGGALFEQGKLAEAEAASRKAIELDPNLAGAYSNLGNALHQQGRLAEAVTAQRKAIELEPNDAIANNNIGSVLRDMGQFAEALTYLRRGHELGSKDPHWPYPTAQWVKDCARFIELDPKLPKILKGEVQPANVGERLELAQLCQLPCKSLNAAAVRFYADAFAEQPRLADDLENQPRYNAACAAARAGCGQGKDADQSDDKQRVLLRRQALEWLRADLAAYRQLLEKQPNEAGPDISQRMQQWQQDTDFAGVRGPEALAKLPEAERLDWQKLWAEVETLRQRAAKP
jgi:tetratricopeptide (TPR) repeat protein